MFQACFLSLPGISKDQQVDVINCIMGDKTPYDSSRSNDATLRVGEIDNITVIIVDYAVFS